MEMDKERKGPCQGKQRKGKGNGDRQVGMQFVNMPFPCRLRSILERKARKRKGTHFMNAPEAGPGQWHAVWTFQWGTAALKLKTLDSLKKRHSGTERNGSFFFSVRLCLENWRLFTFGSWKNSVLDSRWLSVPKVRFRIDSGPFLNTSSGPGLPTTSRRISQIPWSFGILQAFCFKIITETAWIQTSGVLKSKMTTRTEATTNHAGTPQNGTFESCTWSCTPPHQTRAW